MDLVTVPLKPKSTAPYYGNALPSTQKLRASSATMGQKRAQMDEAAKAAPKSSLSFGSSSGQNQSAGSPLPFGSASAAISSGGGTGYVGSGGNTSLVSLRNTSASRPRPSTASTPKLKAHSDANSTSNRLINFLLEETRNNIGYTNGNSNSNSGASSGNSGAPARASTANSGVRRPASEYSMPRIFDSSTSNVPLFNLSGPGLAPGGGSSLGPSVSQVPSGNDLGTSSAFASTRNSILINHMHINRTHTGGNASVLSAMAALGNTAPQFGAGGSNGPPAAALSTSNTTATASVSAHGAGAAATAGGGSGPDLGEGIREKYERKYGRGAPAASSSPSISPVPGISSTGTGASSEVLLSSIFQPASQHGDEDAAPAASSASPSPQPSALSTPVVAVPSSSTSGQRGAKRVRFADPLLSFHTDSSASVASIAFLAPPSSSRGGLRILAGSTAQNTLPMPSSTAPPPKSILKGGATARLSAAAHSAVGPVNNTINDINTMNNTLNNKSIPLVSNLASSSSPSLLSMTAPGSSSSFMRLSNGGGSAASAPDRLLPRLPAPGSAGSTPPASMSPKGINLSMSLGFSGVPASSQGAELWRRRPKSATSISPSPSPTPGFSSQSGTSGIAMTASSAGVGNNTRAFFPIVNSLVDG